MPSATTPTFGKLLAELRWSRRISQSRLAERASFDHSYVSRLESGSRMPTREAIGRFVEALSCSEETEDTLYRAAGFIPPRLRSREQDADLDAAADILFDTAIPSSLREAMRLTLRSWITAAAVLRKEAA